eukprot:CAMPEP_0172016382 /NCGR_PEP_ID=MMETSP1041-20130122/10990_1 /TAXON_ID=464988 /ORGANISM="Hemiselmis andersenii, Strain CCMP439" /LENGTH=108 /DNA_ID=CAMNT_0012671319 /DNA_START=256 /DNA_END=579 /DNA_ORIENTATION=+
MCPPLSASAHVHPHPAAQGRWHAVKPPERRLLPPRHRLPARGGWVRGPGVGASLLWNRTDSLRAAFSPAPPPPQGRSFTALNQVDPHSAGDVPSAWDEPKAHTRDPTP